MQIPKFPFTAVAGQPVFKLALILAVINPAIGGVLVSGPRGSAKSTLARGLADVMPLNKGDAHPLVTLPLGASEEMLIGTLNLQQVLHEQNVAFQEGLLAKANNGILYVDEVNLLQDNLVDLLLDVAASGVNVIERDGISHSHEAKFLLMGTMNPDEGELRPQLQDRFGFSVVLDNQYSVAERVEIVRLRETFDSDPQAFVAQHQLPQDALRQRITQAKELLASIRCNDELRVLIAERCHQASVDGLRADIVWYHAAVAHAAWRISQEEENTHVKNTNVIEQDVLAVEELVLAHRRKDTASGNPPPSQTPPPFSRPPQQKESSQASPQQEQQQAEQGEKSESAQGDWGSMQPQAQLTAKREQHIVLPVSSSIKSITNKSTKNIHTASSKNTSGISHKGKRSLFDSRAINWFTTLASSVGQWPLSKLHYRKAKSGQPVLHLILLDTSASTLQGQLLANAKAAVLDIAKQAYVNRQQLTIVGFGNQKVETLLPQKKAPKALRAWLDSIMAAGGTPLREVLEHALILQKQQYRKIPDLAIRTYLITDGKTTQTFHDRHLLGDVMVIDTEQSTVKRGKARSIATALGADYFPLPA
jgi:magnesium chelatase subunit D